MITDSMLKNWFVYHTPTPEQLPKYQAIREAGYNLAKTIVDNTPPSADQTDAIRKIRESCMTANASIACDALTASEQQTSQHESGLHFHY